jgi:NAD(P)-dependent dehydrogenase (short-subunit alcohol dehydrogenase family)
VALMNNEVLLIGGTSVVAHALAREYARDGWNVIFAGRDEPELERSVNDITVRYETKSRSLRFDATDPDSVEAAAAELLNAAALPNDIIFMIGDSEEAHRAIYDPVQADRILAANYSGTIRFLSRLLLRIEGSSGHRIVLVSSIAGDRGRRTNFIYGAAKAALNTYAQGLRALLLTSGTSVLTVKLGYVDTRLAFGKTPAVITCSPSYAARAIYKAIRRRAMVAYIPWFWRPIMALLQLLPEAVFIRLPLP